MKKLFSYFHPLTQLERARQAQLSNPALPEIIRELLSVPYPEPEAKLDELDFLVFDLETTGMNPEEDRILSIGYLNIHDFCVDIQTANHTYVKSNTEIKPESAVINHIMPKMLMTGLLLDNAMENLFKAMKGKILIAHGTVIEKNFLDHYLNQRFGLEPLPLLWLDTLSMEKSLIRNKSSNNTRDYRLAAVRKRHNLPPYLAHNALADSIATGELFLVLVKIIFGKTTPTIGRLIKPVD